MPRGEFSLIRSNSHCHMRHPIFIMECKPPIGTLFPNNMMWFNSASVLIVLGTFKNFRDPEVREDVTLSTEFCNAQTVLVLPASDIFVKSRRPGPAGSRVEEEGEEKEEPRGAGKRRRGAG